MPHLPSRAPLWLTATCLAIACTAALAEDWPQWRGVGRDGVVHDDTLLKTLTEGSLPHTWTQPVGSGYSGPTVADGRVYVTDQVRENVERVLCFDAATGTPIWQHEYDAVYTIGYRAGPRASVTIQDGRAFAVGAMGHFHCFDAATGVIIWQRDLAADYNAAMPIWGIAASPLVYDDLVIQVAAGQGGACVVALDIATGDERWRSLDEPAGYSAPIVIRQGDQDVLVCWTGASVSGLEPTTGKVLWSVPMASRNMPIGVATPVIQDDLLFVSSFYDGSMLIRFSKEEPTAEQVWYRVGRDEKNTDALHCMISTPILKGDHIYGVDSYGELRCLDLATGDRVWEDQSAVPRNRWATIHILQHGDREIMLNDQGDLFFTALAPDGYHELSRAHLIDPTKVQLSRGNGVVWAHPAIANGCIFARSDEALTCTSLQAER